MRNPIFPRYLHKVCQAHNPRPPRMLFLLRIGIFCFLLLGFLGPANAQFPAVEVPAILRFANLELRLSPGARKAIKTDADALRRHPKFFQGKVDRADAYFPIIERIFAEEQLPDDFKYLVLQESGLVSDAVSSSNAVGFWQFKEPAAREVGLRIDAQVDERINIASASRGAARYLHRNNQYFDNWLYALLAYNTGAGGAQKYVDKRHVGARQMPITENTHWYVLKFLAHKLAYEDYVGRNPAPPLRIVEFYEGGNQSLRDIARAHQLDADEVERYNKWLRQGRVPTDRTYAVALPVAANHALAADFGTRRPPATATPTAIPPNQVPEAETWRDPLLTRIFRPNTRRTNQNEMPLFFSWNKKKAIQARAGDDATVLALQAGIDKEKLLQYNDLSARDRIKPGQLYYVEKKRRKARTHYHTAQPGETLWDVAQQYGVRLRPLRRRNRMDDKEKLAPGRVLWLRHIRPASEPVAYDPDVVAAAQRKSAPPAVPPQKVAPLPAQRPVVADTVVGPVATDTLSTRLAPVPVPTPVAEAPARPAPLPATVARPPDAPGSGRTHTVAPGETLYGIARLYQTSPDSLQHWNALAPDQPLRVGQSLKVATEAARSPVASQPGGAGVYQVQPGDTLFKIARQHGISVQELKQWNQKPDNNLSVGEFLRVQPPNP